MKKYLVASVSRKRFTDADERRRRRDVEEEAVDDKPGAGHELGETLRQPLL